MGPAAPSLPRNGDDFRYAMTGIAVMTELGRGDLPAALLAALCRGFRRFRWPGESYTQLVGVSEGSETPASRMGRMGAESLERMEV